ncbi:MAG: thioredoxin-dependent thiol peroxidase [Actinomycetia bacterium]|nr:thioredoxin-dependent thiol peroxidase [Actinomycetes bacterium]
MAARARYLAGEAIRYGYERGAMLAAIGPDSRIGRRFGAFGAGSFIAFPYGALYGESYIHIGSGTLIAPHVTLSVGMVSGQTMPTNPVISIGDGCLIGRGSAIVGHFKVDIGNDVFTGMNVYITDQNHSYESLEEPIGRQIPREESVTIGAGSWIGSGAVILPGAEIGEHVVVAANAVVRGRIPDRCVVAGVPAQIVRRHQEGEGWVAADVAMEQPHHEPNPRPTTDAPSPPAPLEVGVEAPAFTATTFDGKKVSLGDYKGQKLALYFYPKDSTPGCTKQACNLRDNLDELAKQGVAVVGVSPDSDESHERFASKYELTFPLVADPDHGIIDAYGVWGEKKSYGKTYLGLQRTTFLINEDGVIQHVFKRPRTTAHAEEVISKL